MSLVNISHQRLHQLQISSVPFTTPAQVVASLGAVQAQDYAGFKWSVGLRLPSATDSDIEAALADRSIVRTWALRNTLHTLAAEDVHWVLTLLSERLIGQHAFYYKQQELDLKTIRKSQQILQRTLENGQQLTRKEIAVALEKKGIALGDMRLTFILLRAALDKVICLGARREKEFTYTLLDEWITAPKEIMDHEEALAKLATIYFTGHGPATIKDFAWWTGITATEAKKGLEMIQVQLTSTNTDGQTYWMAPGITPDKNKVKGVFLLPGFDEYLLGYTDRSAAMEDEIFRKVVYTKNGLFNPTIVVNGRIEGLWKRTIKKNSVVIDLQPFTPFSKARLNAVAVQAKRYAKFLELKPVLPFME